jgi:hypothetical protein
MQANTAVNIEDEKEDAATSQIWKSCCFIMHANAVLFFSQLAITLILMMFCIIMLLKGASPEDKPYMQATLTFLCGAWLPQPKLK